MSAARCVEIELIVHGGWIVSGFRSGPCGRGMVSGEPLNAE